MLFLEPKCVPPKWVTRQALRRLEWEPINNLDYILHWLNALWPCLATCVVEGSAKLPVSHCEAVRQWGQDNLWPGHDGTELPGSHPNPYVHVTEAMYQHPNALEEGQDNGKGKGKGPGDEGKGKGPADKGKGKGPVDKGKGKGKGKSKVLGKKGKGKQGEGNNKP